MMGRIFPDRQPTAAPIISVVNHDEIHQPPEDVLSRTFRKKDNKEFSGDSLFDSLNQSTLQTRLWPLVGGEKIPKERERKKKKKNTFPFGSLPST
jgi:hypothetical protein